MSKWRKLTLTNEGAKLLANVTADNLPLVLSCIKFGTGQYDETVVIREMEHLAAEKQTIGISHKEIVNKTTCKITGIITNTGLNTGYYLRELGIYALDADNNEVLFMVNYDDVPDYMPAENDGSAVEQEFSVYITVSDAANVQLSVNYDALAKKDEVEKLIRENGIPVGFERFTTNPNIEPGWKPYFGQETTRTECSDLWNWVLTQNGYLISEAEWQLKYAANDGNVPYYSTGDGSTTFRLPSMKCWVKGANGIEELSNEDKRYLSAGLPNVKGNFYTVYCATDNHNVLNQIGVFKQSTIECYSDHNISNGSMKDTLNNLIFNANDGATIQGIYRDDVTTVQPKSIVGMWQVKAYGSVNTMGEASVDGIASGLATLEAKVENKANRDLDNLTDKGKKAFFPSGTFIELPKGEHGEISTWVAHANGYIQFVITNKSGNKFWGALIIEISSRRAIEQVHTTPAEGYLVRNFMSVKKGETYTIQYWGDPSATNIRFYYAESEVPQ